MKTNANSKNVVKAVENVSKNLYDGNVLFRRYPEKLTKNVIRFTLKTKDATKLGSIVTKEGLKQPKASWDVHQDVMKELFKIEQKPNIYVDTMYGRQYNENAPTESPAEEVPVTVEESQESTKSKETLPKRKYRKRLHQLNTRKAEPAKKPANMTVKRLLSALDYVLTHKELLKKA